MTKEKIAISNKRETKKRKIVMSDSFDRIFIIINNLLTTEMDEGKQNRAKYYENDFPVPG